MKKTGILSRYTNSKINNIKNQLKERNGFLYFDINDVSPSPNQTFEDFNFDVILPYKDPKIYSITDTGNTSKIQIESRDNYLSTNYRDFTLLPDISELDLLNYYFLIAKNARNNQTVQNVVSLSGNLDPQNLISENYANNYFDNYSASYAAYINNSVKLKEIPALKNIVLDGNIDSLYDETSISKKSFSKFINLKIGKDESAEIIQALNSTNLNLMFLSRSINIKDSLQIENKKTYLSRSSDQYTNLVEIKEEESNLKLNYFNLLEWAGNLTTTGSGSYLPEYFNFNNTKAVYVGSTKTLPDISSAEDKQNRNFLTNLYSQIFSVKLYDLLNKYGRTTKDIFENKKCHTELLGFRIDKIKQTGKKSDTVVNSHYFQNNTKDILNFIDTQVKFNNKYKYNIYYYVAVFGNICSFKPAFSSDLDKQLVPGVGAALARPQNPSSTVTRKPDIYVIENKPIPYVFEIKAAENITLSDASTIPIDTLVHPPVPPSLVPIQYNDNRYKDKIKFLFLKNRYEHTAEYIQILDSDREVITEVNNSYPAGNNKNIKFGNNTNDDANNENKTPPYYQIFKLDFAPNNYRDFNKAKIINLEPGQDSLVHTLEINKKFYFTSRAVSGHKKAPATDKYLFSNPTPVFEVEIIKDGELYYPIILPYDFDKTQGTIETKEFQRLLYLRPVYQQYTLNSNDNSAPNLNNTLAPGPSDVVKNIWNKKYKMRITSKQTGRKIDINFKFTAVKKPS